MIFVGSDRAYRENGYNCARHDSIYCHEMPSYVQEQPCYLIIRTVDSQTLTAVAAVAAAIISLINVGLTAYFVRRQAGVGWRRELLPDLIVQFTDAAFRYEREIFEPDWAGLSHDQQANLGMDEYRETSALLDKLEAFANPDTIGAARDLMHSISSIRFASFRAVRAGDFAVWHPERRASYWKYAEAHYRFMVVARREMGLKPPPVPGGLARHRESVKQGHAAGVDSDAEPQVSSE